MFTKRVVVFKNGLEGSLSLTPGQEICTDDLFVSEITPFEPDDDIAPIEIPGLDPGQFQVRKMLQEMQF